MKNGIALSSVGIQTDNGKEFTTWWDSPPQYALWKGMRAPMQRRIGPLLLGRPPTIAPWSPRIGSLKTNAHENM